MEFKYLNHLKERPQYLTIGIAALVLVLIAIAAIVYFVTREEGPPPGTILQDTGEYAPYAPMEASGVTLDTTFTCPGGETFTTSYDFGSNAITLTLPDDRTYTLVQAATDANARYTELNGTAVFVEEGGTGRVDVDGATLYENCTPKPAVTPPPAAQ